MSTDNHRPSGALLDAASAVIRTGQVVAPDLRRALAARAMPMMGRAPDD